MLLDNNMHKVNTHPLFGTRVRLILDIFIGPYSITHFIYLFTLFSSTIEPVAGEKPGVSAPTTNGL